MASRFIDAYIIVFVTNYIYNLKLRSEVVILYEVAEKKKAVRLISRLLNNKID